MDMTETLKTDPEEPMKQWKGRYKGIPYEVHQWRMKGRSEYARSDEIWNYYISLNLNRITNEKQREELWLEKVESDISEDRKFYPMHKIDTETDIYFHGGCTFYNKLSQSEDTNKSIKLGCDYAHYKDRPPGFRKALDSVQHTIDSFYDWVDTYLRRCRGCGKFFEPGTGIENEDGWEDKCGGEGDFCQ